MRKEATEIVVGVVLLSPGREAGSEPNQHEAPLHTAILLSRGWLQKMDRTRAPTRSGLFFPSQPRIELKNPPERRSVTKTCSWMVDFMINQHRSEISD